MSHGGGDDNIEPDLTPLLDLVMQLLMFFIINVNFTNNQTDADTDLPIAGSARPEEEDKLAIFLDLRTLKGAKGARNRERLPESVPIEGSPDGINVREKMKVQDAYVKFAAARLPQDVYKTQLETKAWLADMYRKVKADPESKAVDKEGKVITTIHIRPDGDLELNQLFMLMQSCKVAGFRNIKVHAYMGS